MDIIPKEIKTTCCKSYLTKKGRCFDCVEDWQGEVDIPDHDSSRETEEE